MKKFFLIAFFTMAAAAGFAQSEKYMKAMEPKVAAIDTTVSISGLTELANAFERIGDAEKNQWLPYYYAALANVNSGLMMSTGDMGGNADKTDPIADKAEGLLGKAAALTADNAELHIVRKMIANLRMLGDPMNRYMTYGPQGEEALAKAKSMSPDNPRIYLLEAQDKFFTPEQFGGSKEEAKTLFQTAMKKYETEKPETALHPHWGKPVTQYFLGQIK